MCRSTDFFNPSSLHLSNAGNFLAFFFVILRTLGLVNMGYWRFNIGTLRRKAVVGRDKNNLLEDVFQAISLLNSRTVCQLSSVECVLKHWWRLFGMLRAKGWGYTQKNHTKLKPRNERRKLRLRRYGMLVDRQVGQKLKEMALEKQH